MRVVIIGGGPAGLYSGLLLKKAHAGHDITILERNRPGDTFGFGVVFSDETLDHFIGFDAESYREITDNFAYWDQIEVRYRGRAIRSGGHGFCGIARVQLLNILQRRCQSLGVDIRYETEVEDLEGYRDADLVIGADGVNSMVRERYRQHFQPNIDMRKTKFAWLGTTRTFGPFTFIFRPNAHGWFYVHAYQYAENATTWIVETHEDTWRRAGLDEASEAETIAYCEELFAAELDGHPLLANMSVWRSFPMVSNERWHHENVVLLGDAAHTAQFSIGSGTKIAMEDAAALARALGQSGDVASALAAYEESRRDEVARLQRTAYTSLSWYENARRFNHFEPEQYAFNFICRTKGVTYENLRMRDPGYVAGVDRWFADKVRAEGLEVPLEAPPPMFTPFGLRDMVVANRVVVAPMDMYSATEGTPGDFHLVHLGGLALGGAGLVFSEMVCVSAQGRITPGCAGLYRPEHMAAWRRIVDFVHAQSRAKFCLQLGHSGRKGSTRLPWEGEDDEPLAEGGWPLISASALAFRRHSQTPKEMDRADMDRVVADFVRATVWGTEAGFDMLELHMAHGYLLSSFISPLTNLRDDAYGGGIEDRMRLPLEVFDAVRAAWPAAKPMSVRISATDWAEGGLEGADAVAAARLLKAHGVDIMHVSTGQTTPQAEPLYGRMYQTPFSDQVRNEAQIPTIAVGSVTTPDQVNTIVAAGRADLVALARPHLVSPHFTLEASAHYGYEPQVWPAPYLAGKDQALRLAERANEEQAELRQAALPQKRQARRREAAE